MYVLRKTGDYNTNRYFDGFSFGKFDGAIRYKSRETAERMAKKYSRYYKFNLEVQEVIE